MICFAPASQHRGLMAAPAQSVSRRYRGYMGSTASRHMLRAFWRRARCRAGRQESVRHRRMQLPQSKSTIGARDRSMDRIHIAPFMNVGSESLVYRHRNGVDEVNLVERTHRRTSSVSERSFCKMPRRTYRQGRSYNLWCLQVCSSPAILE